MVVPEPVRERFRAAGADAAHVGLEVAQELIAEAQGRVAGIEVIAPFKAPLAALALLPDLQPPQEPVETVPRTRVERAADERVRHAVAARRRRRARRRSSTGRRRIRRSPAPPESPCRDAARDGGDRARHGPVAVRVLREHDLRVPDAARRQPRAGRSPDSRRSRPRLPDAGRRCAAASPSCADDAEHRDVVVRVERDGARADRARAARDRDDRVALAGDDVRRGDDEVRRREPAAPLDADAARRPEHADDRPRRGDDVAGRARSHRSAAPSAPPARRSTGTGRSARADAAAAAAARRRSASSATATSPPPAGTAVCPGMSSAVAPITQTSASPATAPSTNPPAESRNRNGVSRSPPRTNDPSDPGERLPEQRPGDRADEPRERAPTATSTRRAAGAARSARRRTRRPRARRARAPRRSARAASRARRRARRSRARSSRRSSDATAGKRREAIGLPCGARRVRSTMRVLAPAAVLASALLLVGAPAAPARVERRRRDDCAPHARREPRVRDQAREERGLPRRPRERGGCEIGDQELHAGSSTDALPRGRQR